MNDDEIEKLKMEQLKKDASGYPMRYHAHNDTWDIHPQSPEWGKEQAERMRNFWEELEKRRQ